MKLKKFISEQEKQAVERAVERAEAQTSGEIVPAIVESSSTYNWIGFQAALMGWAAACVASWIFHHYRPFAFEFWMIYAAQILGMFLGWGLSRCAWWLRLLIPRAVMENQVLEAAQSAFLRFGLSNTRDRTGVLVFVSLLERKVQILADRGIHEKVGEGFWKAETDRIAAAIRDGKPSLGMIAAIESIGVKLSAHFPRRADDQNELPNRLRTE